MPVPRPGTAYSTTSSLSTSRYVGAPQHLMLSAERVEFAARGTTAHDGRPIAGVIPPYTCRDASDRMRVWPAFTNSSTTSGSAGADTSGTAPNPNHAPKASRSPV
jgi:hypothetical protein